MIIYILVYKNEQNKLLKLMHWKMNYVRKIMMGFGRMFQRLINYLMLLLIVSMVHQENQISRIFGRIILVLF